MSNMRRGRRSYNIEKLLFFVFAFTLGFPLTGLGVFAKVLSTVLYIPTTILSIVGEVFDNVAELININKNQRPLLINAKNKLANIYNEPNRVRTIVNAVATSIVTTLLSILFSGTGFFSFVSRTFGNFCEYLANSFGLIADSIDLVATAFLLPLYIAFSENKPVRENPFHNTNFAAKQLPDMVNLKLNTDGKKLASENKANNTLLFNNPIEEGQEPPQEIPRNRPIPKAGA